MRSSRMLSYVLATVLSGAVLSGGVLASPAGAGAAVTAGQGGAPVPGPAGYVVVNSGWMNAGSGGATFGTVTCPGSEVPTGGGAITTSRSPAVSINNSYPDGTEWEVWLDNTSGSTTMFDVYEVCIDQPADYEIVPSRVVNQSPMSMATASVRCPNTGTVAVGGGLEQNSLNPAVGINSIFFLNEGKVWEGTLANGSTKKLKMDVFAICMPPPAGYLLKKKKVTLPAGTVTVSQAVCPNGSVSLGGGEDAAPATTPYVNITLASSYPNQSAWGTFEGNGTASAVTGEVMTACAS
jgi:hypothetical protein